MKELINVNMEEMLTSLFDFQRFARNSELQSMIDEVEQKYGVTEMTDDELDLLAAAGDPFSQEPIKKDKDRDA